MSIKNRVTRLEKQSVPPEPDGVVVIYTGKEGSQKPTGARVTIYIPDNGRGDRKL